MKPYLIAGAVAVGLAAAAWLHSAPRPARAAGPDNGPSYYQDPSGKPFWSATPRKDAQGRDYVPVFEPDEDAPAAAQAPTPGKGERTVLYYRNPMGLPDTSPTPKKDAMGMDYIPVYADEAADAGIVRISPGRMQLLGVRTAPVEMVNVTREVRATGTVALDERRQAAVTTKVEGWIETLHVAATGDPVRKGQVLAELYAPELVTAEKEYLVAAGMAGGTHAGAGHGRPADLVEAAAERLRALDVPAAEIARLQRTGTPARRIPVLAPADGVVIEKGVVEGARVMPGEPLYRTADLSTVWLIAEVPEQDLHLVRPGQTATAMLVAFPGRSFEGKVDFIYPSLSRETRTARVRILVPNPDRALLADMYATVTIASPAGQDVALAAPSSAILDSGSRQVVLVDKGDGRFEPRPVKVGARGGDRTEILEGLAAGEQVVVGANFLIDAESNLRAALQAFGAPADGGQP